MVRPRVGANGDKFGYRSNNLLLVIDGNVVDRLPVCVGARACEGQGLAVRRYYAHLSLDRFPGLCTGHLHCRFIDYLVGACVEVGDTRHRVGLSIIEVDSKDALRWIALGINTFISGPETLSDCFVSQNLAPRRWPRAEC